MNLLTNGKGDITRCQEISRAINGLNIIESGLDLLILNCAQEIQSRFKLSLRVCSLYSCADQHQEKVFRSYLMRVGHTAYVDVYKGRKNKQPINAH